MVIKKTLLLLSLAAFFSCGMKTRYLRGDSGKVPVAGYEFSNRHFFTEEIFNEISTVKLYRLTDSYYSDKQLNRIENKKRSFDNWILLLQFYENGCVRRFPEKMSSPNPEEVGNRGIVYMKDKQLYFDICEAVSNNKMVINTYLLYPKGNQLFVLQEDGHMLLNERICYVFEKSEPLSEDLKKFKADW